MNTHINTIKIITTTNINAAMSLMTIASGSVMSFMFIVYTFVIGY